MIGEASTLSLVAGSNGIERRRARSPEARAAPAATELRRGAAYEALVGTSAFSLISHCSFA